MTEKQITDIVEWLLVRILYGTMVFTVAGFVYIVGIMRPDIGLAILVIFGTIMFFGSIAKWLWDYETSRRDKD